MVARDIVAVVEQIQILSFTLNKKFDFFKKICYNYYSKKKGRNECLLKSKL